jgi:hypothetical protein
MVANALQLTLAFLLAVDQQFHVGDVHLPTGTDDEEII